MSERENILARIREALTVTAPPPGQHDFTVGHASVPAAHNGDARRWLPSVGPAFEQRLELFRANALALKAEFSLLNSPEELRVALLALRDGAGWKKVASHAGELTEAACKTLDLSVCRADQNCPATEMESCDVGITECDALVAQTGSVLVTSRSAGGRTLSVLPPHHLVLARREQLLGDLPDAFALLQKKYASNYPSFISFITGPSRTGDIERILVLGAHGPKKLTILCL